MQLSSRISASAGKNAESRPPVRPISVISSTAIRPKAIYELVFLEIALGVRQVKRL
jgi:hypothetical protein